MHKTTDHATDSNPRDLEKPVGSLANAPQYGSDVVASLLREFEIPYFALVPGSSFRGLQDSLVNYLGNRDPQMVVCLHEEHAVAIANGYARVTDKPMAVGLHANVGLMHAVMTVYSTWCDRLPMLIFGATGPVDAHKRRPWIDWVHTAKDQGALIRNYVKWDDQPASPEAAIEAVLRARQIATTAPCGPTYVCMDVSWQEEPLADSVKVPDIARFAPPAPTGVTRRGMDDLVRELRKARKPLFLFGRNGRSQEAWDARVRLAEIVGAAVMTSIHNPSCFPSDHPQHVLPVCGDARSDAERELVADSDLIVNFDWMDFAGFLRTLSGQAQSQEPVATTLVHCSPDAVTANGWSMDHQALPAADIHLAVHPDILVDALLEEIDRADIRFSSDRDFAGTHWSARLRQEPVGDKQGAIALLDFAMAVRQYGIDNDATFVRFPIGWPATACRFDHPLSYLGTDGGASIGIGPGQAVGAALALRDSSRLVTAVLGDGDTLMGINALWTASHLDLPMLIVVANNKSYFNDELHQERVANARGRPAENRWIGQRIDNPEANICMMAEAQGFQTEGPVRGRADLQAALERAAAVVKAGGRVLIDCHVEAAYAKN